MRATITLLAGGIGLILLADRLLPPDLSRVQALGTEVLDREGRILAALPAPGGIWRLRTTAAEMPPHLLDLLTAAEDRRFRWHPGVDPLALARAALQWVRAGHVVSGGSTLTMQAARLLEPRPRTIRSKAIEIARALQLEARFTKDEILGIWLTLAPQGGNLEGLRAGALAWFGRPPASLDPSEAALLVALARRPEALRPDRHPEAALAARNTMLSRRGASLTPADAGSAHAAPVPCARRPMPALARHLARELARGGGGPRLPTTLDLPLQRAAEAIAGAALLALPDRASVAIIVADLERREVRALVGGAFGAEARAGSLDLTRAIRSPGSALKPALYALAFEAGIAAPDTLLADLPRRYGGYAPENFDRGFAVRITVADALRQSLNMPAVALLAELGPLRFAAALKAAGVLPRLPAGTDPALPLALGGLGTTLREMAALYAALGDAGPGGGQAAPLRLVPGPAVTTVPVFQPRAAGLATAILVTPFPAGGPPGIAWKTGTSWGGRDAWAMGLDARHVVGIWVGRPDGTPMVVGPLGASGARIALPLLARMFERLPAAPRAPLASPLAFRPGPAPTTPEAVDRLRLVFPPTGAVLDAGPLAGGAPTGGTLVDTHVTLRASGGRRPLTFLVDGRPVPAEPARREAAWQPTGPGFYRLVVLDADGAAARAEVRVR